ncbi:hypothetical protein PMAYCL1PPCAC_27184, partial [Pristionchus mayeri]
SIMDLIIHDTAASNILSMASNAKRIQLALLGQPEISDPVSFIAQLDSVVSSSVQLIHNSWSSTIFFRLPHIFWERFLNEKLSSGLVEYVYAISVGERVSSAPIDLPDDPIIILKWKKVKAG